MNTKIINPVTNEEMSGCVWYYWNEENKQYIFEYDSECKKTDDPPEVNIIYNNDLINKNGWAKENISVSITGIGEIKYCIGNSECEPNDIIETGNNTKFITIEGTNYICAIASNSLGSSEKKCEVIKLDKTIPNIEGIGDKVVQKNEVVNLKENVTASDSLSGIDGEIIIEPNSIDTSVTGIKKVTYKVKDKAGNEREVIRNIIVDAEAPTIVYNLVNPSSINSNGWAKANFYVRATITDNSGSGIKVAKSCTSNSSSECVPTADISGTTKDFYIEVEGNNRLCIEVTDNNNKTTKICSDTYKLDKTVPVVGTASLVGTMGSNDWYTSDVTVNVVNGSDSLSGHLSTTSNTSKITTNSTGTTVIITTTDLAGNSATRSYTVKLDKNSPTLTDKGGSITITQGDSYIVSNYFNVGYSISGGNVSCNPTNTNSLGVGTQTVSCTATEGFSQTACGFVVEFVDPIVARSMNGDGFTRTNVGGWPASEMHITINNIYNSLQQDLKNVIIDTYTVSGYGSKDSANFVSTDKLYLLSPKEIWEGPSNMSPLYYDTAKDYTRQLDYYKNNNVTNDNYSAAIKYDSDGIHAISWWLRTAVQGSWYKFAYVENDGSHNTDTSYYSYRAAPAFRIG